MCINTLLKCQELRNFKSMDVKNSTNRMSKKIPSKYSCIVPGCSSKSREPGHLIPKKAIGLEWVKQIRNQDLLKDNTVPTLNLPPSQAYEDLEENINDPVAL
ncbi:uncharacterized protein [Prorops nasuta]|uniref:uncharacterized protein n=1 Tax=Prorops nasuta TaxID=863751 RepID=UPI0034CD3488